MTKVRELLEEAERNRVFISARALREAVLADEEGWLPGTTLNEAQVEGANQAMYKVRLAIKKIDENET